MAIDLIYCADGGYYADIAINHGFKYGKRLPSESPIPLYFADQNWKNPNRDAYMQALKAHAPYMATVLDLERECQFDEVMSWASEASQYVQEVLIIPKYAGAIERIPETINGKKIRLAYSVPTRYGGSPIALWEFNKRHVHLLGGSPKKQFEVSHYLNAVSADGNYTQKVSLHNQFFNAVGGWNYVNEFYGHIEKDANYLAFELSCMNIKSYFAGCKARIRFATENDLLGIQAIAKQFKQELGFVMNVSLKEAIANKWLHIAEYHQQIVGFVNFRKRKDGGITIYEIATAKNRHGENIGRGLIASLPAGEIRLKCTVENPANKFYKHIGFVLQGQEAGRKRQLNVWVKE